jgi:endonuclease-3 related protein
MTRKKESVDLLKIYELLFSYYGPQGWWPLTSRAHTDGYDGGGYHKSDYKIPQSDEEKFEIIMGAVLTQNTAWTNVSRALKLLFAKRCTLPEHILNMSEDKLADLIRSSGYYNQKAKKLKRIAAVFHEAGWLRDGNTPLREDLLALWGVGEETADSILLYAFGSCLFVVDAYTKRLFQRLGLAKQNATYAEVQSIFHKQLKSRYSLYNEYHALIVQHAKIHCRKKPVCTGCPLAPLCLTSRV